MFDRGPKLTKFAEVLFGGLAKGTMVAVGIAAVVLAFLGGGDGLTDLPITRKEWGYFLLIFVVIIGLASFISVRHLVKTG